MRRLATLMLAAGVASVVTPTAARGALFFLFKPTSAKPGDRVTVRTAGTPPNFRPVRHRRRFSHPIRVYLVRNDIAAEVRSRRDARLSFVGGMLTDINGHGIMTFAVPKLRRASYAAAAWCPDCAFYSNGRTFFAFPVGDNIVPRYRRLMLLRIAAGG